jgi:hypothetical protein
MFHVVKCRMKCKVVVRKSSNRIRSVYLCAPQNSIAESRQDRSRKMVEPDYSIAEMQDSAAKYRASGDSKGANQKSQIVKTLKACSS